MHVYGSGHAGSFCPDAIRLYRPTLSAFGACVSVRATSGNTAYSGRDIPVKAQQADDIAAICSQASPRTVRILLADDHTLVRAGIRSLVESIDGVDVVGETGDGAQVAPLVEAREPDILLLDLAMPNMHGIDIIKDCDKRFPNTRVLVLSMHAESEYVREAMAVGAAGFLVKDSAPEELPVAIGAVMNGDTFVSPRVSRAMFDTPRRRRCDQTGENAGRRPLFTPRQRDVLRALASGQSTKQIAAALDISVKTVETHRARIMQALGISTANALVRFAVRGHYDTQH